ncbi:hypothetical protein VP01_236g8 [Puccinia sorghi]|uniref:HAT C-terminal dimerisation domain-containing protein n=1 Tax=Puccinia sorghi TaxID=27349 RepID=A0A0L6V717_9BASI|nr:hypothetical protein VP01_236g8 [Puccinia sorghi]
MGLKCQSSELSELGLKCQLRGTFNQLPTLEGMAQSYLSVLASSAPTKRAFSAGRYIQEYTCNQLNVDTLQALLCLKNWLTEAVIDVDNISM